MGGGAGRLDEDGARFFDGPGFSRGVHAVRHRADPALDACLALGDSVT
ncbi:hypothetical protein [Streptomyces sp. NPDC019937]